MGRGRVRPTGDGARRGAARDELRRRSGRRRSASGPPRDRRRRPRRARPAQAQPGRVRRGDRDQHRSAAGGGGGRRAPTDGRRRRRGGRGTRASPRHAVRRRPARGCSTRWTRWTRRSSTSTSTASRGCRSAADTRRSARCGSRATIADADVVISMPKMKTHHWAGLTLSLKNCFGCVPGRVYGWPKNALHWAGLEQAILDVAAAVRPDYAIVDGIVGMEGNGPISGTPVAANVLVFGDDPVATDVVERPRHGVRSGEGRVPRGGGAVPGAGRHGSDPFRRRGRGAMSPRTSPCSRASRR